MELRGYAFPPPAFNTFCRAEAALCSTSGITKVVDLTPKRRAELEKVNSSVNNIVTERSDITATGTTDRWNLPDGQGDCEDIAIKKKSELIKLGWPRASLLLTVARSKGEGHTVLTVRTSEGDLILDNMTSKVRDWSRTPYEYFARQSQFDGRLWERIGSAKPL